jgi:hypothetical protein
MVSIPKPPRGSALQRLGNLIRGAFQADAAGSDEFSRDTINQMVAVFDKPAEEAFEYVSGVVGEMQQLQVDRLKGARRRFSYALTFMKALQLQQLEQLYLRYNIAFSQEVVRSLARRRQLEREFARVTSLVADGRGAAHTCVLVVTMHSRMPTTRDVMSGRAVTVSKTFTVPPDVTVTRMPFASHSTVLYSMSPGNETEFAFFNRFRVAIQEGMAKRQWAKSGSEKQTPNYLPYLPIVKFVNNALNQYSASTEKFNTRELYIALLQMQQHAKEGNMTLYNEKMRYATQVLNYLIHLVPKQPSLLLPGELCPDKMYSLDLDDVNGDAFMGITLYASTSDKQGQADKLVSKSELRETLATFRQNQRREQTAMLPFCDVNYHRKANGEETFEVSTSLEKVLRLLVRNTNFRNFIVVDSSCNAPYESSDTLAERAVAERFGEKVTRTGMAGGYRR